MISCWSDSKLEDKEKADEITKRSEELPKEDKADRVPTATNIELCDEC